MRGNKPKRKTAWHRTLFSFLLILTIMAQTVAGAGIGAAMQAAAGETEAGTESGAGNAITDGMTREPEKAVAGGMEGESGKAVTDDEPGENMEAVELTDGNRYGEEFSGQPTLRYPAAAGTAVYAGRAAESLEDYIVAALKEGETTIDVSDYQLPFEENGEFIKILKNHPELFYIRQRYSCSSMVVDGNKIVKEYQTEYIDGVTKEQIAEMSAAFEMAAEEAAACAEPGMEPYEKALVVHDYLIQNCKYDSANYWAGKVPDISHTAYGALVEGVAVCDGYAGAYLYIMKYKLGINCRIVSSEVMNHAWNMLEIDGEWYHVDTTWDDPAWDKIGLVCHNNFLLSDSKIKEITSHREWDGDIAADSDTYDEAFWIGIESAICSHNGGWYYSKYQEDAKISERVRLLKRDSLLDGEETVVDTFPVWRTSPKSSEYWMSSFMFLVKSGNYLYYNTPTEIHRLKEDGSAYGVFSLEEALGNKQIFGFTMKDGDFLYAPYEEYVCQAEQKDIQTVAAADVYFKVDEICQVDNPTKGEWSYIYFGTYPQTEVTGDDLTDAIRNASYDTNGDATVDGVKYRRIYTKYHPDGYLTDLTDQYYYYRWEPIRWRVLQKTDDRLFIMSDMALNYITYHTTKEGVAWNESQMRDWLNNDDAGAVYEPGYYIKNNTYPFEFYLCEKGNGGSLQYIKDDKQEKVRSFYMTAFDEAQRSVITAQGDDKIFLLSADDVKNESYGFGTEETMSARILQVSEYADKRGFYTCMPWWWLRSDSAATFTAIVTEMGEVKEKYGNDIVGYNDLQADDYRIACVPAMYISTDSDQWVSEETVLHQERVSAKETLGNYRSAEEYRRAERKIWSQAVTDGKEAINQAKSRSAVKRALETALAKIDGLKTDLDYRIEEREALDTMGLNPKHHCSDNGDEDTTDWTYIYFGSCPQTRVTDEALIEQLNALDPPSQPPADLSKPVEVNGGKYSYIDESGWFKWEPVKWRILQSEEDTLFVAADLPVEMEAYARNELWYYDWWEWDSTAWDDSNAENFLNDTFLNYAFSNEEKEAIVPIRIDGKESSVYLLSYEEATDDAYGFCKDGTKASASRRMEATDYILARWEYEAAMNPSYEEGGSSFYDSWWLRNKAEESGEGTRELRNVVANLNRDGDETGKEGSIEVCDSVNDKNASAKAYIVPALRVSKSSVYWSFDPVGGSNNNSEAVKQAVESAKQELETSYLIDDYSEEAWEKVLAAIEAAKEELEEAEYTSDVVYILKDVKQEIAKIPNKEQEKVLAHVGELSNPLHTHVLTDGEVAKGDEDKDVTEWSYVYFGSYPQSEVTDKKITDAVDAAIEAGGADAVDTGDESSYMEIYDAEISGSKYRRLKITAIGEGDDVITSYYKWEPIKWKVLQIEEEDHSLYLMADQKLEYRQMNSMDETASWKDSDLRKWLNQDFYTAAFSGDEQKAVITQQVQYPDADHGNVSDEDIFTAYTTDDKVYLLSYNELYQEKYGFCPLHDNRGNGNTRSVSSRRQTRTDYVRGLVKALPGLPGYLFSSMISGEDGAVDKVLKALREDYLYSETDTIDAVRGDAGRGQHAWTRSPGSYIPGSSYTPGNIAQAEQLFIARTFNYGYVCPVGANQYKKQGVVPVLHVDMASGLWKTELDLKKDAAKAELAACKADDSAYLSQQLEECRAILDEGNENIQNARSEMEIADALQAAGERLNGVPTIGELKLQEWEETHPGMENLANPVAAENPLENSATYSYVYFGSYPQPMVTDAAEQSAVEAVMADKEDGEDAWVEVDGVRKKYRKYGIFYFRWEPIKWRILQKDLKGNEETSSLLLMADNGLDVKKFNESGNAEWKDSTLREWLTGDFYNNAFNLTQQEALISPIQAADGDYITGDLISLPSYSDLLKEEYGFSQSAGEQVKSRAVSPSGYVSRLSFNASMWWQSSTVYGTEWARVTAGDGSADMMLTCDQFSLACVPIIRVKLFEDGTYALNPDGIKAGQSAIEEISERIEQYEEAVSDYNEEDREALRAAIAQAKEAIEDADGDAEAIKNALAVLEAVFAEKTEGIRAQLQAELDNLKQEINYEDYYEAQQNEIEEALEQAKNTILAASDVKTMRNALAEAKNTMEGIKTKADIEEETQASRIEAANKLNAYQAESELEKYDGEEQNEIRAIIEEALSDLDDAADSEAVQAVLKRAEERIADILTKEQKELSAAKEEAKKELEAFITDEKKALYRDAEWKVLTDTVSEAMKEVGDAADRDAVQAALSKAKTEVAAIKTDAQLTEEEQKPDDPKPTASATDEPKPTDSGTTEPKPTDPGTIDPKPTASATDEPKPTDSGTTEPKPTDSGTTEPKPTDSGAVNPKPTAPATAVPGPADPGTPVLKAGDSLIIGNLKFVVMDPVQKTVSVEGAASAKAKKFAVNIPAAVVINGSECKVTEVKNNGFAKYAKITKVSLGSNITKVGKNAFDGCKAITSLTVKGDVKTFESKSFNGCKKLKTITFKGKSVPAFKSGTFKGTASGVKVKLAGKMSAKDKTKMKSKLKKAGIKKIK